MTISFTCQCGKQLQAKDEYAGKRAKCPACGRELLVRPCDESQSPKEEVVAPQACDTALSENTPTSPLITQYRKRYQAAMAAIDEEAWQLVEKGKDMRAVLLIQDKVGEVCEIHGELNYWCSVARRNADLLRTLGSKKINAVLDRFGSESVSDLCDEDPKRRENLEAMTSRIMVIEGLGKPHWLIKQSILNEIESMFAFLEIFVEPDFYPWAEAGTAAPSSMERYIPTDVRLAVWRRDQARCVQCGSQEKLEYDHIIPASKGGSNTERNVQLLCEKCNREKSARIM